MALYIGNPTNVVVSEAYNISFITYSAWMLLPTVVCILLAYIVLRILFRGDYYLPRHILPPDDDPKSVLIDPQGAIFGLVLLACCLGTLVGTSFAHVPVWMVTLPFAFVMFLRDVRHDLGISFSHLFKIKRRFPRPFLNTAAHDQVLVYGPEDQIHREIQLGVLNAPPPVMLHDQTDIGTTRLGRKTHAEEQEEVKNSLRLRSPTTLETQTTIDQAVEADNISLISTAKKPKSKYLKPFYHAFRWFGSRFPTLKAVIMRMPWSILPFSLGMFILIEALAQEGWVGIFATAMAVFAKNYVTAVLGMVFVSIIACQLLNNLVSYISTMILSHILIHVLLLHLADDYLVHSDYPTSQFHSTRSVRCNYARIFVGANCGK